jgi:hypothetical protein
LSEQTTAPEPAPIPFKKEDIEKFANTVDATGSAPTGLRDCMKAGGHGGPKGDRWYYQTGHKNAIRAQMFSEVKICEICGTVDI